MYKLKPDEKNSTFLPFIVPNMLKFYDLPEMLNMLNIINKTLVEYLKWLKYLIFNTT